MDKEKKIKIPKFYHLDLEIEEPKVLGKKLNEVAEWFIRREISKSTYRKMLMLCIDVTDTKDFRDRGLNALNKVYKATRNS